MHKTFEDYNRIMLEFVDRYMYMHICVHMAIMANVGINYTINIKISNSGHKDNHEPWLIADLE